MATADYCLPRLTNRHMIYAYKVNIDDDAGRI